MICFELRVLEKTILCAALFVAHFVCVSPAFAEDITFRSADEAVVVTGQFVGFDGTVVTLATDTGPLSFIVDEMVCVGEACPELDEYVPRVRMSGAPRMAADLLPALLDAYARDVGLTAQEDEMGFYFIDANGAQVLQVELTSSTPETAFDAFLNQSVDIFLSMRELREDEIEIAARSGLGRLDTPRQARILALDALVAVTDAGSDRSAISMADLTAALAGSSDDFDVVLANDLAGQLHGFEDRFMQPFGRKLATGAQRLENLDLVRGYVADSDNTLTLLPFGEIGNTQPLSLTGPCNLNATAAFLTMKTEDYPLTFPMFLYLPKRQLHPDEVAFLDWFRSPTAQLVIRRAGFVDLAAVPIPLSQQGDRLGNAILNAGSEIPLGELQRMVRVLEPQTRMSNTFRFEPGSTRLDGQSRSNVFQLAQAIRDGRFSGQKIMFVGFSDGLGPAAANRNLSAARAEAVQQNVEAALGGNLPTTVQIETEAFGEALPMACDDTDWGQQTNRRVELWVQDTD